MLKRGLAVLLWFWLGVVQAAPAQILVSVAPLQSLVKDLWPDADVQVLMSASEDFHHFQWQPAQLAQVQQAQWVVWLGPVAEPALAKVLQRLPADRVIELLPKQLLAQASAVDVIHAWLHPQLATHMLQVLGERWQKQSLAASQQARLQAFWQTWQQRLAKVATQPFAIQHDLLSSWVEALHLTQRLAITSDHEHEPGVQQILQISQKLQQAPVVCYLQTQSTDPWWPKIQAQLSQSVQVVTLDVFATHSYPPVQDSAYLGFLQQALVDVEKCLQPVPVNF